MIGGCQRKRENMLSQNTNNYVVYHLHSDISSAITNIDSINKSEHYVDYAKSLGMTAMNMVR